MAGDVAHYNAGFNITVEILGLQRAPVAVEELLGKLAMQAAIHNGHIVLVEIGPGNVACVLQICANQLPVAAVAVEHHNVAFFKGAIQFFLTFKGDDALFVNLFFATAAATQPHGFCGYLAQVLIELGGYLSDFLVLELRETAA